jgi:DNA repair exonuclease SbcCD ATPase subunit
MEIENIQMVYHPAILGIATIRFVQAKHKIDTQEEILRLLWPSDEVRIDWSEAEILSLQLEELSRQPVQTASAPSPFYSTLPPDFDNTRTIRSFKKDLANWLYYNQRLRLRSHDELNVLQRPDENLRDFNVRIRQAARETRDQEVDALEKKYDRRLDALAKKMRRLERDLADDEAEYKARQREEAVGVGETVLSFFMGRRRTSAATTIARRRRMTAKVKRDIEETEEEITELKEDIHELEQELEAAINAITSKWDQTNDEEHYVELKPRRRDVTLHEVAIAWAPFWHVTYARGGLVNQTITIPAYTDSKTQLKNE